MTTSRIAELPGELRALHKALLQVGRAAYEREHGPIAGPTQLFHLVVHDPAFAWLRPLSEMMADLDELLDAGRIPADEEQGAVRGELEHLLSPAGGELWTTLTASLQQEADVATAYAAVRQILLSLPAPPPP